MGAAGACKAVIAVVAEAPGPADAMDWGRVVVMPEMGSDLAAVHIPRGAFFRAHVGPSPAGEGITPFACDDVLDAVELPDAVDASDDDELLRWTLLRGMNILKSSPLVEALGVLHP